MKIYHALHIGEFHINYCEDFLVVEDLGTNTKLIAVLDGCTMGRESVFASILYGKILRKIAHDQFFKDFVSPTPLNLTGQLKEVVIQLMEEASAIKNRLGLEVEEMLSTLILGIVDTISFEAELLVIGDGLICQDGSLIEYDQENRPDYLGYHLAKDYSAWFDMQKQRLSVTGFNDLSISTDGIFTFKNLIDSDAQMSEQEIIEYLLIDLDGWERDNFLNKKINILQRSMGHTVTDDLAIVRLIRT